MKRVKSLIDKEEYSLAAAAIEDLIEAEDEVRSFQMYNNLGQCYLKCDGGGNKAISCFKKALSYESQPPALFWKSLSEAYDMESLWSESGDSLAKQYETVKVKGNYNKAIEICKSCLDRWQKTKKMQGALDEVRKCCKFLHMFLQEEWLSSSLASKSDHLSLVVQLIQLQYRAENLQLAAAKSKLSSKASETQERPPEQDPMNFSVMKAIELIISAKEMNYSIDHAVNDESLCRGLQEIIQYRRSALLILDTELASSDEAQVGFRNLFSLVHGLVMAHKDFALPPVDAASFAFEAWLNSGYKSFENVTDLADVCLANPDYAGNSTCVVGAHIVRAMKIAESGALAPMEPHLRVILSYWSQLAPKNSLTYADYLQRITTDRKFAFLEWATYLISINGAFERINCTFMREAVPVGTYLALTQQAKEWVDARGADPGLHATMRGRWAECIYLSRIHSLLTTKQYSAARAEVTQLMPAYFSIIDGSTFSADLSAASIEAASSQEKSKKNVKVYEDRIVETCRGNCMQHLTSRLFIHALLGMQLYAEAGAISDKLMTNFAEAAPSYLTSDRAYVSICEVIEHLDSVFGDRVTLRVDSSTALALSVDLSTSSLDAALKESFSTVLKDAVTTLQDVLKVKDAFVEELASEVNYRIGVAIWVSGGTLRADKRCVSALLSCAKLSPSKGDPYTLLGHHYHQVGNDNARAAKCYLKALQCSPLDAEAGLAISSLWMADLDTARDTPAAKAEEVEAKLLKLWADALKLAPNAAWVLHVRGRYYLQRGLLVPRAVSGSENERARLLEAAASDLQRALELQDGNSFAWYLLGLARFHLWRHSSAKAALIKSHRLDPTSALPLTLNGRAALRSGQVREADRMFAKALAIDAEDILALKGAAQTQLLRAYLHFSWGWSSGAAIDIKQGLDFVERAIVRHMEAAIGSGSDEEGLLSLWKLKADLCTLVSRVDVRDVPQSVSSSSLELDANARRVALVEEGEVYYRKIVEITSNLHCINSEEGIKQKKLWMARAWNDVGCNLYSRLVMFLRLNGVTSGLCTKLSLLQDNPQLRKLNESALQCFREGLNCCPECAECWVGVGVCHSDHEVACACLVRASQLEPQNVPARLNLALRLASCGSGGVAKDTLDGALMLSSEPGIWTAVGLLKEQKEVRMVLSDQPKQQVEMHEAHDAFRIALEVASPAEACLGIALTYLRMNGILNADECISMAGAPFFRLDGIQLKFVADHVSVYTQDEQPFHPMAWCLLGWLREQQGDRYILEAIQAYKNSLQALETVLACAPGMLVCGAVKRRVVTIAESASGRLAYISLRASSTTGTVFVGDYSAHVAAPLVDPSRHPNVCSLVESFVRICTYMVSPDASSLSQIPGTGICEATSMVALQAWSLGDIGACAKALRDGCSVQSSIAESLVLLKEFAGALNQQMSQQLIAAFGELLVDMLCGLCEGPLIDGDLVCVLTSASTECRPLLEFLLGHTATLTPFVWIITTINEAASISDQKDHSDRNQTLCRALLRLGLIRWPCSSILFLYLGESGGGNVSVEVSSSLLSRGLLIEERDLDYAHVEPSSDYSADMKWSASRCMEQAVTLSQHCLKAETESYTIDNVSSDQDVASTSLWNQNWVEHSLLSSSASATVVSNANTAAAVLGIALLRLDLDSPLLSRSALLKAVRWYPDATFALLDAVYGYSEKALEA